MHRDTWQVQADGLEPEQYILAMQTWHPELLAQLQVSTFDRSATTLHQRACCLMANRAYARRLAARHSHGVSGNLRLRARLAQI